MLDLTLVSNNIAPGVKWKCTKREPKVVTIIQSDAQQTLMLLGLKQTGVENGLS